MYLLPVHQMKNCVELSQDVFLNFPSLASHYAPPEPGQQNNKGDYDETNRFQNYIYKILHNSTTIW
jgi:hypothetical protein